MKRRRGILDRLAERLSPAEHQLMLELENDAERQQRREDEAADQAALPKKAKSPFAPDSLRVMTLQQVADQLRITRQAAGQAEQRALRKLRKNPHTVRQFAELVLWRRRLRDQTDLAIEAGRRA